MPLRHGKRPGQRPEIHDRVNGPTRDDERARARRPGNGATVDAPSARTRARCPVRCVACAARLVRRDHKRVSRLHRGSRVRTRCLATVLPQTAETTPRAHTRRSRARARADPGLLTPRVGDVIRTPPKLPGGTGGGGGRAGCAGGSAPWGAVGWGGGRRPVVASRWTRGRSRIEASIGVSCATRRKISESSDLPVRFSRSDTLYTLYRRSIRASEASEVTGRAVGERADPTGSAEP